MTLPIKLTNFQEIYYLFHHSLISFEVFKTALSLGLFEKLTEFKSINQIKISLNLKAENRTLYDFFDKLVIMEVLIREGIEETSKYKNSPITQKYFCQSSNENILEFCNLQIQLQKKFDLYEKVLKSDQNSFPNPFDLIYTDLNKIETFLLAMKNFQETNFKLICENLKELPNINSCLDIGGGLADLSYKIKKKFENINCFSFDLPIVEPVARKYLKEIGYENKIELISGDFFKDEFKNVDCVFLGNILHDWNYEVKNLLIKKCYNCLNKKGIVVIIESFIDNERINHSKGVDISISMVVESFRGYNMTPNEFDGLAKNNGFLKTEYRKFDTLEFCVAFK